MKGITSEILLILGATPADFIIISMGFSVVLFTIFLYKKFLSLSGKYHILNANHLVLWSMVCPEAVKWHYSGEYHIDIKALVDIAEARNRLHKKANED